MFYSTCFSCHNSGLRQIRTVDQSLKRRLLLPLSYKPDADSEGFEPSVFSLEGSCSVQLSYESVGSRGIEPLIWSLGNSRSILLSYESFFIFFSASSLVLNHSWVCIFLSLSDLTIVKHHKCALLTNLTYCFIGGRYRIRTYKPLRVTVFRTVERPLLESSICCRPRNRIAKCEFMRLHCHLTACHCTTCQCRTGINWLRTNYPAAR